MPTVTAAPTSPLARLMAKIGRLPHPTDEDRARWRLIAEDQSPVLITDDAPDMSRPVAGIIECAPPTSFPIDRKMAAWYKANGGVAEVKKALREHQSKKLAEIQRNLRKLGKIRK